MYRAIESGAIELCVLHAVIDVTASAVITQVEMKKKTFRRADAFFQTHCVGDDGRGFGVPVGGMLVLTSRVCRKLN